MHARDMEMRFFLHAEKQYRTPGDGFDTARGENASESSPNTQIDLAKLYSEINLFSDRECGLPQSCSFFVVVEKGLDLLEFRSIPPFPTGVHSLSFGRLKREAYE